MPSLIDIRRRIRSVKNMQQITKAMKMVSAAKLRRAQERAIAARPLRQDDGTDAVATLPRRPRRRGRVGAAAAGRREEKRIQLSSVHQRYRLGRRFQLQSV